MDLFNLRDKIRDTLNTTDLSSPADIAAKVANSTPPEAMSRAYLEALTVFVRSEMGLVRRQPVSQTVEVRTANPSNKVSAIREAWRAKLRDRFHVGNGDWSLLGDCTYEHVLFIAKERHDIAQRTETSAKRFDTLATEMKNHGVTKVADLPDNILRNLLSGQVVS